MFRRNLRDQRAAQRKPMSNSEITFLVEESPEGGYEAKSLGNSIYTQAYSLDELRAVVQDAGSSHFDGHDGPQIIRLRLDWR